jgi:hypothetical protein
MDSEKVLVRPEQPRSESIARISIEGELVRVYYPEKRDSFRRLAKRLGYVWKRIRPPSLIGRRSWLGICWRRSSA